MPKKSINSSLFGQKLELFSVNLICSLISNKDLQHKFLSHIMVSVHIYSGFAVSRYPPPPNEFFRSSIKTYSNQRIALTDPPQVKRTSKNSFQFLNIKSEQTLLCSMYLSNICDMITLLFYFCVYFIVIPANRVFIDIFYVFFLRTSAFVGTVGDTCPCNARTSLRYRFFCA